MLFWIRATVASVARPSPTDSISNGVAAPGRCRLAMPSLTQGMGDGGREAGQPHDQEGRQPEQAQCRQCAGAEIQRESAVGGGGDGDRDQRGGDERVGGDDRRVRTDVLRHDQVAEQRGARDARGAAQRPEREAERGQQTEAGGQQQAAQGKARRRRAPAASRPAARRRRTARRLPTARPSSDPDRGEAHDLDQAHRQDQARRRAEAAQCRDRPAARVEPGADAVGDADAADEQRGQADQGQEQARLVEKPRHLRRGLATDRGSASPGRRTSPATAAGTAAPPAAGRSRGSRSAPWCRVRSVRSRASAAWEISTLRPEDGWGGDAVGLGGQRAGDPQRGGAETGQIAWLQTQTIQDQRIGEQPEMTVALRQRRRRSVALARSSAVPTSGHAASTALSSIRVRSPDGATSSERIIVTSEIVAPWSRSQVRSVSGSGSVAAVDRDVAAENAAAVGGEAGIDGGPQAADRGDHADAQSEAEQDGGEASDAAAQFPAREPDARPRVADGDRAGRPSVSSRGDGRVDRHAVARSARLACRAADRRAPEQDVRADGLGQPGMPMASVDHPAIGQPHLTVAAGGQQRDHG